MVALESEPPQAAVREAGAEAEAEAAVWSEAPAKPPVGQPPVMVSEQEEGERSAGSVCRPVMALHCPEPWEPTRTSPARPAVNSEPRRHRPTVQRTAPAPHGPRRSATSPTPPWRGTAEAPPRVAEPRPQWLVSPHPGTRWQGRFRGGPRADSGRHPASPPRLSGSRRSWEPAPCRHRDPGALGAEPGTREHSRAGDPASSGTDHGEHFPGRMMTPPRIRQKQGDANPCGRRRPLLVL